MMQSTFDVYSVVISKDFMVIFFYFLFLDFYFIFFLQKVKTARHTLPSMLYVPDILAWWDLVDETARIVFTSLIKGLDRSVHMLVLATIFCDSSNIPIEVLLIIIDIRYSFLIHIYLYLFFYHLWLNI